MKKYIFVLLIMFLFCILIGCVEPLQLNETTDEPTSYMTTSYMETTQSETYVTATTILNTTSVETTRVETKETTKEESEDTTNIETEVIIEKTTYETLPDMFERLMEFSGDRGYFYGKADIRKSADLANEEIGVHFRVVGFDHDYRGIWGSYYYVQIIETYGEEKFADQIEPIDREKIYLLHWRGHLDDHLYGRPPLQIGEDYFRYITWNDHENGIFTMGLVMDIEEIDGKQYLYGYGIDMSVWDCAEKITDYEENQIYKVGQHDKVIAYLNGIGKSLPTFDYRCELFEWMDEVGIYTKE